MDDDLKLVEELTAWAAWLRDEGLEPVPGFGDGTIGAAIDVAATTITRLHGCRTAYQDTIDRLVKERDEALADTDNRWLIRMADIREASGIGVKPMLSEVPAALAALRARAETAEAQRDEARGRASAIAAQRDAALEALGPFADKMLDIGQMEDDADTFRDVSPEHRRSPTITVGHFRAASRAIGGDQ